MIVVAMMTEVVVRLASLTVVTATMIGATVITTEVRVTLSTARMMTGGRDLRMRGTMLFLAIGKSYGQCPLNLCISYIFSYVNVSLFCYAECVMMVFDR